MYHFSSLYAMLSHHIDGSGLKRPEKRAIDLRDLHEGVAALADNRLKARVPEKEDANSQKLKSPCLLHQGRHETALEQRRFDPVRENIN
jgi:hypothetical protein